MARVTVEDCLDNVDNRFQLVLMASKRARQIARGSDPRVPWENDKPTVLALREIAGGQTGVEVLDEPLAEDNEFGFESFEPTRTGMEGGDTASGDHRQDAAPDADAAKSPDPASPDSEEPPLPEGSEGASI